MSSFNASDLGDLRVQAWMRSYDFQVHLQKQLMERVRRNLAKLSLQRVCSRLRGGRRLVCGSASPATHSDDDLALASLNEKGIYVHPGHFLRLFARWIPGCEPGLRGKELSKRPRSLLIQFNSVNPYPWLFPGSNDKEGLGSI